VRTKIALAGLGTLTAFSLATNPVVAEAARTITGKDIKNNSVTGKDVKDGSLVGADLKGGSVGSAQIQDDGVTGVDVAESTLGKVPNAVSADQVKDGGVTAPALADGAVTGRSLGPTTRRESEVTVASGDSLSTYVACPAGSRPIGGGAFWIDVTMNATTSVNLHLVYSRDTANGWQARGFNGTGDNDAKLVVDVLCLSY